MTTCARQHAPDVLKRSGITQPRSIFEWLGLAVAVLALFVGLSVLVKGR